jgi:hypothetical protein
VVVADHLVGVGEVLAVGERIGDRSGDDEQHTGFGIRQVDDGGRGCSADERHGEPVYDDGAVRDVVGEHEPGWWAGWWKLDSASEPDEMDGETAALRDVGLQPAPVTAGLTVFVT